MQSLSFTKAFCRGAAVQRAHVAVQRRGPKMVTVSKVEYDVVGASYANALVEVAQSNSALEAVHADIDALASVMKENEQLKTMLSDPTTNEALKKSLIKRVAAESGFSQYTINFLSLLVDANRVDALEEICEAFETRYCTLTDTQVATLRSAVKLEQEQQFLIAKKLQELTGSKNIKLKPVVDQSLIAGFVVEWGSSQLDLSVAGSLQRISGELISSAAAI